MFYVQYNQSNIEIRHLHIKRIFYTGQPSDDKTQHKQAVFFFFFFFFFFFSSSSSSFMVFSL